MLDGHLALRVSVVIILVFPTAVLWTVGKMWAIDKYTRHVTRHRRS